jgi:pyruvate kinase
MSFPSFVRSKIVCTIGPASKSKETLLKMIDAGMDVARINMSHGELEDQLKLFETIREVSDISILIDLPGPKIRLGDLRSSYTLNEGDSLRFTTRKILGDKREVSVSYYRLPREVTVGGHLFINDGAIDVEITSVDSDFVGFTGKVISGGEISSRKGVNAPGASLSMRPPTEKDIKGIKFGVDMDCDWFAASFIRNASDVESMRKEIERVGGDQPIISKIEHGDAIKNISEIIEASDGVMVARGDLGIEIQPWDIPLLQKKIIAACNQLGKPVIVATQMLESMMMNPRPTRAEASDVANALLDGADAVMLSGETAIGRYPVESVQVMNSIGWVVQEQITQREEPGIRNIGTTDLIGELAARSVEAIKLAAIIVVTRSGVSALQVSKHRPKAIILTCSKDQRIERRMNMYWGVKPLDVDWTDDRDRLVTRAIRKSIDLGYIYPKDYVALVSGSTLIAPGQTTTLEILRVEDIRIEKD